MYVVQELKNNIGWLWSFLNSSNNTNKHISASEQLQLNSESYE